MTLSAGLVSGLLLICFLRSCKGRGGWDRAFLSFGEELKGGGGRGRAGELGSGGFLRSAASWGFERNLGFWVRTLFDNFIGRKRDVGGGVLAGSLCFGRLGLGLGDLAWRSEETN